MDHLDALEKNPLHFDESKFFGGKKVALEIVSWTGVKETPIDFIS
jgi:hypothetical protein